MEDGRQARFLFLPEGEDPDTVVRSGGAEPFRALLREAVPLETFLFESLSAGLDTASLDGRARLSKLALRYLRQLPGLELQSLLQLPDADERHPGEQRPPPEAQAGGGHRPDTGHSRSGPHREAEPRPRQRPAFDARPAGYANLAQGAIALILHRPEISLLADPAALDELEGDDIGLLRELLHLLRKRPESNTAMLLGHWYGTPEGELLSHLAGQERLIPTEGIERQFVDTMEALAHLPHKSKFAEQVDKLKSTNYAEISELEKQRIREMLQAKRQRDEARSRRK